jgi:prephenate dehydratase
MIGVYEGNLVRNAMSLIAALGPESTFSEIAAKQYAEGQVEKPSIQLFPTIKKVLAAVGERCSYAILPIENMIDGYVQPALDLLVHSRLTIIDELLVPINFSFVANSQSLDQVQRIFVQFATEGQCAEFLESFPEAQRITTQSNGESLQSVINGGKADAAIIPRHALAAHSFPLVINDITDYENNTTRFIVLAEQETAHDPAATYKTSLVVMEGVDRPGMLSEILSTFSKRDINLVSIMSRPTKESMGKYHFFIDIEGYALDPEVQAALAEVRHRGNVKLLGSYPKARGSSANRADVSYITEIPALTANPFLGDRIRPTVCIAGGKGPYANTRAALSSMDLAPVKGKRVLLKPNAGRIAPLGSGTTTHPQVVAAAIDAFREAGAVVSVGESPITGVKTSEALESSGIAAIALERGCTCIDMDRRPPVEVTIADGTALETLKVCADLFDFDIIVSMPVMKMHMHTGVTLAVKNMKGCLWQRSKVDLHMLPNIPYNREKSLNIAIADMASVLKPHLSIIDGTIAMEGLGPSAGEPKPLDMVVVGADPFATDSIACRIMGISAEDVPHLRIGAERGYGVIDCAAIRVLPADWQRFINPLAPVPESQTIDYPNVNILDEKSCSACQSTVLLFLKRHGEELSEYLPPGEKATIVIGKGHRSISANSLCVGNCTRQFREQGIYIPGCPPVVSSIQRILKKRKDGHG